MATKTDKPLRDKIAAFFFTPVGMTVLLGAIVVAAAFVINIFDDHFVPAAIQWFRCVAPGPDSSTVLLAVGSISVVVWTGALIAFQFKGPSVQLSGAFSLLQYAYIAPLVALLFQDSTLRIIAVIATLAFAALVMRQAIMYFVVEYIRTKGAAGDPESEFLATDLGRRVFKSVARVMMFPIGYAGACGGASLVVAVVATEYAVAVTSLGALCVGLYYVLIALKNEKDPPTPSQRATVKKTTAEIIAIFQRHAAERANSATGAKEVPDAGSQASPSPADDNSRDADADEVRAQLRADLREVAGFLEPFRDKQPRPGDLTQEQIEKARVAVSYAMSKAVNDEEAFNAALGLSLLLAAAAPAVSDNKS
jgi:hypothetical protein